MRDILHVDLNAFYASVEQAKNPSLRGIPVAVAGNREKRTGIILTASYEARKYGVKTGMLIGDVKKICPDIVFVSPNFEEYIRYSDMVMDIIRSFSPDVEIFSIDEAWVDVTGCRGIFGTPLEIGDMIREKIKKKLDITASVGVSYCKVIAKMASELKKPDGTSVVGIDDLKEIIWPLPIKDLFGVGRRMRVRLNEIGIYTIGDLAGFQVTVMEKLFGKVGRILWYYANGIDTSRVSSKRSEVKGIGNSITTPKDMVNIFEAGEILMELSESVGRRLREQEFLARVVEVVFRTSSFETCVRQRKLSNYTKLTLDIYKEALKLLDENWDKKTPLRLLGVRVTGFKRDNGTYQISLFDDKRHEKNERLDLCLDKIREKHGQKSVMRASLLTAEDYVYLRGKPPFNPFNGGISQ